MGRKIVVDGHEIVDAEIECIAIVKRGANRAPFKIMKREEDEMHNQADEQARRLAGRVTDRHGAQEVQLDGQEDLSWLHRKDTSFDALERHARRRRDS